MPSPKAHAQQTLNKFSMAVFFTQLYLASYFIFDSENITEVQTLVNSQLVTTTHTDKGPCENILDLKKKIVLEYNRGMYL